MPGGRRIPITVDADTKGDFDKAARGLDDVAKSGDDADKSLGKLTKGHQSLDAEINKTATSVKSLRAEFDKTGDIGLLKDASKLERTRQGLERLRAQFTEVGRSDVDVAKVDQSVVHLGADIDKTKAALKGMGEEFQRTGKVNVDELKTLSNTLRELERAKVAIGKLMPGDSSSGGGFGFGSAVADIGRIVAATLNAGGSLVDVAKGVATTIGTGVKDGLSSLSSLVQDGFNKGLGAISGAGGTGLAAWLVPGIAAAAPAIGAAINAAVLLGVGGGALAAGIIAAAQNADVQAAYKDLGGFVVQTFKTASEPLVEPLLRGASKFEGVWVNALPGIRSGMAQLGPVVDRLVDGVAGFVEKIGPGFGRAFEASLPLLKQVGAELPKLGSALSSFFDSMARGGPGAVMFFHDLMTAVDMTVVWVGKLVEWLSRAWELSHKIPGLGGAIQALGNLTADSGDKAKGAAGDHKELADALDKTGDAASRTSDLAGQVSFASQTAGLGARIAKVDFATLSAAISDTGSNADLLAGKMTDRLMGTMLGMSHATLGVQSGLLSLKDTLDQNGLAVDRHTGLVAMNTKAGIANRESVLSVIEGNLRMYDAQINSGVGADVATAKYEANTRALHDQLREAGLTEKQVGDLIGEYGRVPGKVSTAIATQGLTDAINNLSTLLQQLLGLPTHKTITIDQITRYIDNGNMVGGHRVMAMGGIRHAAVGMVMPPSDPGWVLAGEPQTGGEVLTPLRGISQSRAMELTAPVADAYNFSIVPNAPRSSGYASPVMPRGAGAGGGGGGGVVEWRAAPGDQVAEVLLSLLRPTVRGRYGGDVNAAVGGAN